MSDKIAEISNVLAQEEDAKWIVHLWDKYHQQMQSKIEEWKELRNYIFATDTTTTSNKTLPWKNSTTLPKLCQIRDNLHANYRSALFPNDRWMSWEAYDSKSSSRIKAQNIEAYMDNKAREGGFERVVDNWLYDYIDYGNAFGAATFEHRYNTNPDVPVKQFVGPKAVRISPLDIVFNPMAVDFNNSFKIIRSIKTKGELKKMASTDADQAFWLKAIEHHDLMKRTLSQFTIDDINKSEAYSVDGFGNIYEYYSSEFVEVLEFYGDYNNPDTGEYELGKRITVVNRSIVVQSIDIPTYDGLAPIHHVGWRDRPDNLWAMGPLDNLVGLQYRLDHLENLKADAMDLVVHPPLKIIGEVEEFVWGPGAEIHIDENGDVAEVAKNLNALITAEQTMQLIEDRMELYAGAPRQAAGIRTPGEKTKFEVATLENAAGRIFQDKIIKFETHLLEPVLNDMLSQAHRNFDRIDAIRVLDKDLGVKSFREITKEDITANGVLRPVGARHFAQKAQIMQDLVGIFNSPIAQMIAPHTSGIQMTELIKEILDLRGWDDLFRPNVAIQEQQETQRMVNNAQENLIEEDMIANELEGQL